MISTKFAIKGHGSASSTSDAAARGNLPHNFIADQLHLTRAQGLDFAQCMLSIDDYIDLLIAKQIIAE